MEKKLKKMVKQYLDQHPNTERNILFLDFDGVINGPGFHVGKSHDILETSVELFQPEAIHNLNTILEETHAEIVVSSFWRHMGLEYCRNYLYHCGVIKEAKVIDVTGAEIPYHRDREILQWLQKNPNFTNFVILDDLEMNALSDHHVRTTFHTGITKKEAQQVIDLFHKGPIQ